MKQTSPSPSLGSAASGDEMNPVAEVLAVLWSGRWILPTATLVGLGLGIFQAWRATPIYRVDAMLQVEAKKGGKGNAALATMNEGLFDSAVESKAEVEILKSNLVLGRAVEALRLDVVAEPILARVVGQALARGRADAPRVDVEGFEVPNHLRGRGFTLVAGEAGVFSLMDDQGGALATGRVGEEVKASFLGQILALKVRKLVGAPGQRFSLVRVPLQVAIGTMRSSLGVAEKATGTNILGLTYEHPDPSRGAEVLNAILDQYVRQNIERKAEEASKTLAFLQEQLPLMRGKLDVAEERLNQFRASSGSVDLNEETKMVLQQSVSLERDIMALRQKREELLRSFQKDADPVVTVDQQIAKLQGEVRKVDGQVQALPRTQQEVLRLTRDFQVNQELYTALLNNSQQMQMAKAGEIGNVRIVDHATPTLAPVSPQKARIQALGALVGLLAGLGFVLGRRALKHGVENPQVLEARLGLPVLVTIPHSRQQDVLLKEMRKGDRPHALLASAHPEDLAVESLRSLRTSLHFTLVDAPNRIVLIAGPSPSIGKSFVSANFASVLSQTGARVLLVDADMRKGKLHHLLGLRGRQNGLSEVLSGQLDWQMALQQVEGFHVLTSGTIPPNPSELLMGPRLGALLQEATGFFDYILIDTPPVLAVTDAMIVGAHAGAVLMALKAGEHPVDEIRVALQRLDSAGIQARGAIFNDVPELKGGYAYSRYAYHYGYAE